MEYSIIALEQKQTDIGIRSLIQLKIQRIRNGVKSFGDEVSQLNSGAVPLQSYSPFKYLLLHIMITEIYLLFQCLGLLCFRQFNYRFIISMQFFHSPLLC